MSNADVGLLVANELGTKVLDAIQFPIKLEIKPLVALLPDGGLGAASVEVEQREGDAPEFFEISKVFESHIVSLAQELNRGSLDLSQEMQEDIDALKAIAASVLDGTNVRDNMYSLMDRGAVKNALRQLFKTSAVDINIQWVRLEIEKPSLRLQNPIALERIVLKIQVQVKACVKIFGRRVCVTATSPNVRIEGRQALLKLFGQGSKILATPEFRDIDIVIKIKILGLSFDVRIGITTLINGQLQGQAPILIMDLSTFEQPVPFSNKRLRITGFDFPSVPDGLGVNTKIEIQ
jgi:hypothetical protein